MARPRRIIKQNAKYHVTGKFNGGSYIFDLYDFKALFLQIIARAKLKYSFDLIDYNLMGNHYHLTIIPRKNDTISRIMQYILSIFARKVNKKLGSRGHIWNDRFRSKLVESNIHDINTTLYIYNNPIRANLTDHPLNWEFSSLHARVFNTKSFLSPIEELNLEHFPLASESLAILIEFIFHNT